MADDMIQAARMVELEALVREFGEQFRFYEASHRAKGTPEADAKADVNDMLASRAEAALRAESAFQPADTAPSDTDLIIAAVTLCDCEGGPGIQWVTIGSKENGEWENLGHPAEIIGWAPAPAFPTHLLRKRAH